MLNRCCYLILLACFASFALPARAADDSAAFLDAMRRRGMYDLALQYLNDAKTDRLATAEFRNQIPYERGVTLIAKWQAAVSASERDRLADQIKGELSRFIESNQGTPKAADAQQQLASLLEKMATRSLAVLESRPSPPDDAEQTKKIARQQLVEARELLTAVEKSLGEQLGEFPKVLDPKTQASEITRRREMRERLAVVRVKRSALLLWRTETMASDAPEFKKLNEEAANEFQELYDKYDGYGFGFTARVLQGECYKNLGEPKKASGCFEDVIVRAGDTPTFRDSVTKAFALQAELMLADEDYDAVIAKQGAWLATARGAEGRRPDWLALKYHVAEAKRKKAAAEDVEDNIKRKLTSEAREHYTDVSQRQGEYQDNARQILAAEFEAEDNTAERLEVKTFDEALTAAKEAINSMNAARQTLPAAKENNPDGVPALEARVERGFDDALYYLDVTTRLVDDDTPVAKLNETRWLYCWLLWQDEQYHRAAVLASFLAWRYPEDPTASGAAQVALSCYDKLYQQAVADKQGDGGAAEVQKLKELASFITRRWGATALGNTAFGVLLNFSIKDREFDVALDLADQLPAESQPAFKSRIANAMWKAQLRAAETKDATVDRESLRQQATELLNDNFAELAEKATAANTLALSSLYLAQSFIERGDYDQAIDMLENEKTGPIALSKSSNRVASREAYAVEAYKAALRAYVSVVPPQTDKAVAAMADLEEVVGDGGGDKLTKIYLRLGFQLQQQVKDLLAAGKTDEAKRVSEAFVAFLDKLNERGSDDPVVRRWIAQTYYQLAEGLEGNSSAKETRTQYYARASDAFAAMLETPPPGLTPGQLLVLRVQFAQTLRRAGKFKEAMDVFEAVLAEKEMMIEAQTAAAYTLQEWGEAKDSDKFAEAIAGSGPLNAKGKHVVWGWNYMGKVAASVARTRPKLEDRFKALFYESWLNIARISLLKNDAKKSRKFVEDMVKNYPDLLKMPIRSEYDDLMKSIQRKEGLRATGLDELLKDE